MIRVAAIFKGQDGSLGYRTGKSYELWFWTNSDYVWIKQIIGDDRCPYDSLKLFLDNWEVIN